MIGAANRGSFADNAVSGEDCAGFRDFGVPMRGKWGPKRVKWVPSGGKMGPFRRNWVPNGRAWVPNHGKWVPRGRAWVPVRDFFVLRRGKEVRKNARASGLGGMPAVMSQACIRVPGKVA